jgi:hypothetical protein
MLRLRWPVLRIVVMTSGWPVMARVPVRGPIVKFGGGAPPGPIEM